jgi:hypothetical protein
MHRFSHFTPEIVSTDRGLDSDGQTRGSGYRLDELQQLIHVVEGRVSGRTLAGHPHGNAADRSYLGGDLRSRENTPESRLRPLTQLDLDGPNRGGGDRFDKSIQIERAIRIPATEIPGPDLPNEIAAIPVMVGDSTLTCRLQRST